LKFIEIKIKNVKNLTMIEIVQRKSIEELKIHLSKFKADFEPNK
jgi:hypothetical protein